jgi:DNA mismatch repair ATPase MutS
MNVFLLYKDRDIDMERQPLWNEKELTQDLEMTFLLKAMSREDDFLFEVARTTIFAGLENDFDTIIYRQQILKDCLKNSSVVRSVYDISVEAIESRRNSWYGIFTKYPSSVLSGSIGIMELYLSTLKQLRVTADDSIEKFQSVGFRRFFAMIQAELTDEYLDEIQQHLNELRNRNGILISYELGKGNKGIDWRLRKLEVKPSNWFQKLFPPKSPYYSFDIHPRDESGAKALSQINDEGINLVANALAQSNDHILHFFKTLRTELAFYTGCLNLHEQLDEMNEPSCFPDPVHSTERKYSFRQLYDVCLALKMKKKIVGNDLNADGKSLFIITGANQGGKSTFLRSIGLSQLMMQSGMFVPAESFTANICSELYTHFKREEDRSMKSGKFDEELSRMNDITNHIKSNAVLLFNESFAATNDREGSEIARQIVSALLEKNFKVFFVTHLYEFAHSFYDTMKENAVFLRAERQADTTRTFKLTAGEPLQTSYGIDVYHKVFGNE